MKKNAILFAVFLALLGGAYWLEEIKSVAQKEEAYKKQMAMPSDTTQLQALIFPNAKLIKEQNGFVTSQKKWPVDNDVLQSLFEKLSQLHIERELTDSEISQTSLEDLMGKDPVTLVFEFPEGPFIYRIGLRSPIGEGFYVEMEAQNVKRWTLVKDHSTFEGVYRDLGHGADLKYQRLLHTLLLSENYFVNRQVVEKSQRDNWQKDPKILKISNQRNRPFAIHFQSLSTQPPIIEGLKYKQDEFQQVLTSLLNLRAQMVFPFTSPKERPLLTQPVSTMELQSLQGQALTFELFEKFGERTGYFLVTNMSNHVFTLSEREAKTFFLNVQDFWDKRVPFPPELGQREEKLSLKFPQKGEIDLIIPKEHQLQIKIDTQIASKEWKRLGPNQEVFKEFLGILFGEGALGEAQRVSTLSETQQKRWAFPEVQEGTIEVKIGGERLRVLKQNDELIIGHLDKKYNLHFLVGDSLPFDLKFEDFFHLETARALNSK